MCFKRAEPTLTNKRPLDGHPYALNGLYSQMLYIQLPELAVTKLNNVSVNKTCLPPNFACGFLFLCVTSLLSFGMLIVEYCNLALGSNFRLVRMGSM